MTVKIFIMFMLDNAINRHQLKSINMRRNVWMHSLFLVNISKIRNWAIYQQRNQFNYILFLLQLIYSINKAIRIHVFYYPWYQHWIIWVMNMRPNISSGVSKNILWVFRIKVRCTSAMIFLWDITKKKKKKDSIIVLRNCIHPRHMIYFGISILIQLCVLY